ncbi:MAG: hypothetical protein ACK5LY_05080 [Lachnospirales bacterium]
MTEKDDEYIETLAPEDDITKTMETILQDDESDSAVTQLKYFFTSWSKYFKSVNIAPKILIFLGVVVLLTLCKIPFREGEMLVSLETSRTTLEELYSNEAMFGEMTAEDIDILVETSLSSTENMYTPLIYSLTNVGSVLVGLFINAVFLFILAKIFRSKIEFKKVLAVSTSAYVLTAISYLIYAITLNLTGSSVDILSLGILMPTTDITSPLFVVLNSINVVNILLIVFYSFMGIYLLNFKKTKAIIFGVLSILIPTLVIIIPVVISNAFLNAFM